MLGGTSLSSIAARRKTRNKAKARGKGKNQDQGGNKKGNSKGKRRGKQARAEAIPSTCCGGGNCTPGPSKDLRKCCFENQPLAGKNFRSANVSGTVFKGANLTGATFAGANIKNACFVDANVTGANFAGTNPGIAIFCRTQTDSGIDNAGCAKGNPCCPTCDAQHPCSAGQVCCQGRCQTGDSCAAADCAHLPDRTCQTKVCTNFQCGYSPLTGTPCDDGNPCTVGDVCQNGVCTAGGAKDCSSVADACNDGVCRQSDGQCVKRPKADGGSCGPSLRCCGGGCLPTSRCCTNGTPDACPGGQKCCGGTVSRTGAAARTGSRGVLDSSAVVARASPMTVAAHAACRTRVRTSPNVAAGIAFP